MGDIADMMLEGILDCETGEYLGEPCGYPRTFSDRVGRRQTVSPSSTIGLTKSQRKNAQRKRSRARAKAAKASGAQS